MINVNDYNGVLINNVKGDDIHSVVDKTYFKTKF